MSFIYAKIGVGKITQIVSANDNFFGKNVPGFPKCISVTESGEVFKGGRKLKGDKNRKGYRRVCLRVDGKDRNYPIHTLVALAFHGIRPSGWHVDHIDFDILNNNASNLRYLPALENTTRRRCVKN